MDLSFNYLEQIEPLSNLVQLEVLNLDGNAISGTKQLKHFGSFDSLIQLSIKNNPVEQLAMSSEDMKPLIPLATSWLHSDEEKSSVTIRLYMIHLLPRLQIFNNSGVSIKEKYRAKRTYAPSSKDLEEYSRNTERVKMLKQYARIRAFDSALSSRFRPVVLAGLAGVGKRTLTKQLLQEYPHVFGQCISHTTRAPRPGGK